MVPLALDLVMVLVTVLVLDPALAQLRLRPLFRGLPVGSLPAPRSDHTLLHCVSFTFTRTCAR